MRSPMALSKSKIGTVHVIAVCCDCDKRWESYTTAVSEAQRHAAKTGHRVNVERGQTWTYNPR